MDKIVNSRMHCRNISGVYGIRRNISGVDSIEVTVDISLQRCRRNIFYRDASRDDGRNLLLRDAGRDDCRNSFLRDVSRDNSRNPLIREVSRDDCRDITVEILL